MDEAWVELPPRDPDGFRYHGVQVNMERLIRAHPRIGAQFGALFLEVMFGDGALEYEERELVAAVTAAARGVGRAKTQKDQTFVGAIESWSPLMTRLGDGPGAGLWPDRSRPTGTT